jgi:hypothetical protein
MYSRLMHILHEFDEVEESLSNSNIVGKIFRAMMRRPKWESMISTLEAMQDSFGEFTHEKYSLIFYTLRRSYDKMESSHQNSKKPHFKLKDLHRTTI